VWFVNCGPFCVQLSSQKKAIAVLVAEAEAEAEAESLGRVRVRVFAPHALQERTFLSIIINF
jgi:hypothetical protein